MPEQIANPSLPLHAVLEIEFAQLYGDLPTGTDGLSSEQRLKAYWSAVHQLEEPSGDDARLVLRVVRDFVMKYLSEG